MFVVQNKERLTAAGIRCADHVTPLYPQKLALTSPTGGGCSVGIVRSRTKATEFSFLVQNKDLSSTNIANQNIDTRQRNNLYLPQANLNIYQKAAYY
jgi:hypothetical protein